MIFIPLAYRVLPVLQLTRMALVFTAVADAQAALWLWWARAGVPKERLLWEMDWRRNLAMAGVSIGLYGFGMALNDIIDRHRDQQLAAHRPLPSGRLGVVAAHVVAFLLLAAALLFGGYFALHSPQGVMSVLLLAWTILLIVFYDLAGKYLVAPGLLALGMIRFFHAALAAPSLPVLWQPLLLLNHVTILSVVCYQLEAKRPVLTRAHRWGAAAGLVILNCGVVGVVLLRNWWQGEALDWRHSLRIEAGLIYPAIAAAVFAAVALWNIRRSKHLKTTGEKLMLWGLLWLIVYDAAFVGGYIQWLAAGALLLLLPAAWISVQLMRWWSRLVQLASPLDYQPARGDDWSD